MSLAWPLLRYANPVASTTLIRRDGERFSTMPFERSNISHFSNPRDSSLLGTRQGVWFLDSALCIRRILVQVTLAGALKSRSISVQIGFRDIWRLTENAVMAF